MKKINKKNQFLKFLAAGTLTVILSAGIFSLALAQFDNGQECGVSTDCKSGYCDPAGVCANKEETGLPNQPNTPSNGKCPEGLSWNASAGLCMLPSPYQGNTVAGSSSLAELIKKVIDYLLFFAGMVAVVFIVVGGFWFVTSAGNEEQAEKGRKALINAIIGLVVVILSFAIVTVISNLITKGPDQGNSPPPATQN